MESSEARAGMVFIYFWSQLTVFSAEFQIISNDVKRDWRRLGSYSYPDAIKFWTFSYL